MPKKKPAKRKIKQADKPADGMRIEFVSVAELLPYAANARTHSPEQVKQIVDSILEFGFTNPVLIDANNELVAGHGRVMAAKELGHDLVPCIRLGHLSELQVRAYRLADNKIALNSGWDDALLKAEIEALQKLDVDLHIAGFSADEIEEMIRVIGEPPPPRQTLSERFGVPPFSVLDARQGYWQDRKRAWLALGIKSEIGRGGQSNCSPGGSELPACDYSSGQRGDGRGRIIQ